MDGFFGIGLSGREIYEQVTGGPGTGSLDRAWAALEQEAALEEQRAQEIRQLADEIQAGWQGAAADGAVGVAGPMADTARERVNVMRTARGLLEEQSEMFNHTKNSVVPVPAEPPKSTFLNDLAPWETDLDRQIKQYQNDVQHNFDEYARYDNSSLDNEQRLPRDYPSNTEWGGNVSVTEPGSSPDGGPNPGGSGPNPGGGPDTASGPSSMSGPPRTAEISGPPQGTDPEGATPPPNQAPPGTRPPIGGPLPPGNQPPPGGLPPVGGPVGSVPPGGRGLGFGADGGGRGGSSAGGPGVRGGGLAEGGPGGRGGPGARGGAIGEHGPGGRPGAGAGGLVGEEAAARRGAAGTAGGRGAGGAGGYGPMGAGRGRAEEDYEHERKYLIGPDPEDTFGADELTAPPVIGDEDED